MTTFFKSKVAKAAVGLLALAIFAVAGSAHAYTFTQKLSLGMTNAEVMALQQTLNSHGFIVSATGAGSPGMESSYFGAKTMAAVQAFQAAKGIVSSGTPATTGYGQVGPTTRAALTAMSNGSTTNLPLGCTSTSGYSSTTGASCATGVVTNLPAGCSSTLGYSPTTGLSCAGTVQNQTGPVTASLSTTNPASSTIVAGQATAKLLDVVFAGNGTVNSVTLKRTGISDQSTLQNVYLYDGVTRLTDGYSFNNNGDITINNLNLAVNGSRTVSVVADVYASAPSGQTVAVSLTGFTSGTSVSTVTIQGNTMTLAAGGTLAAIGLSGSNTVVGTPTVNAGTTAYAVFRQALQVNTRTVWLKSANFRITGSAQSGALANAGLFVDGVKVGNNASMTMTNGSNYLSFDLSAAPFALTTGSHTMEVRADIVSGSSYNFTVSLQQASDLMIFDPQVGVNLSVCGNTTFPCTVGFSPSTGAVITIGAGSATFTVDPSFSSMTNITGGASNAVIGRFKIHGYGEDVKITSLPISVSLSSAATPAGIQNVTLYFNGSQVGSQVTLTSGTGSLNPNCLSAGSGTCYSTTFNLGSQLIIPAGTDSILEVRADLRNATTGTNYTAGAVQANLGSGTGEGFTSHTSVTTPAVSGTSLTVQTGLLAVAKNPGYSDQALTPNTAGVKIGSFILQNQSSSESVRVTGLTVGLTADGTQLLTSQSCLSGVGTPVSPSCSGTFPALTNFSGLRTSETATPVQPQASNTFTVDFTLAPNSTKVVDIFADTSSGSGNIVTTLAVSALGVSSNTSIAVTAVTGQTISLSAGTITTPTLLTSSATSSQYIAAGCDVVTMVCGNVDATKASYNFVSTGGASTISELKFTITGTAATYVRVGSVSAPVIGGVAWLTGLNLAVPQNGSGLSIDAYISYGKVGTGGTIPNTTATTSLTYVKYSSGGNTNVLTPAVAAPAITVVGSKPTVAVNTTTNTGLNLGADQKIGEITVSADSKGNIKLNDIQFAVSASGFTTNPTFTNARLTDGSTTAINGSSCGQGTAAATSQTIFCEFGTSGNTFTTTTGVATVESNTDFDGYTIAANSSKTFSLYATVSAANTGTNSASISTSLVAAGFNWDDASYAVFTADGTTASPANGTALNGSLIYNFPTGSYTIKQ